MLELDLLTLAVLLALSAFFSGVETALVSIDRVRARQLAKKGSKEASLLEEFQANPYNMLSAILIGNNVVNIASTAIATNIAIQLFQSHAIGIAIGVMTFLILVFGEITPKSIAVQNAEFITLIVIRPIKLLSIALSPLIWLLGSVRKIIMRIIGTKEPEPMTEQDVKTMVTIGAEVGAIDKEEREMIHRIFKFDDIEVEQVMTPRVEMKALPAKTKLKDIKKLLAKTPYSRIPVYKKELDNIIGIFYVKDAWEHIGGQMNITLEKFVKPAIFVPKTKKIDKLLAQFQREHIHMAIVVGDYGGVLGLVTLEDLLEEIVGEIVDESDPVYTINKAGKNKHEVNGRISLEQVNKALGTTLKSSEYDTLSGFMIEKFDRLPKQNEKLKVGKHTLVATRVRAPKILMITILKNQ